MSFELVSVDLIEKIAKEVGVPGPLARAICEVESGRKRFAVRFEPRWIYFYKPEYYAAKLGITEATERTLQAMSWGPAQVMGTVSRELGHDDFLTNLVDPNISLKYAFMKLSKCIDKWGLPGAISAYNGGTPVLTVAKTYINQGYVDKVQKALQSIV